MIETAAALAEQVKPLEPDEDKPKLSIVVFAEYRRMLERLVIELRDMETVDPYNNQLREWAEDLVEAFDAVSAAYDEIHDRMIAVRGMWPESYAHLYLAPNRKQ